MEILTKPCLQCGTTITKPYNESLKNWSTRHKFCSRSCSMKYRQPGKSYRFTKERHYIPPTAFKKGERVSIETEFKKGIIPWMKGKTHSEETRKKISLAVKGKTRRPPKPRPSTIPKVSCEVCGKEFQPRQRIKANRFCSKGCMKIGFRTGQTIPCLECGIDVYVKPHHQKRNKRFCSQVCRYSYQAKIVRSVSSIRAIIRSSDAYQNWVKTILRRDNWTCQNTGCAKRGGNLEVHHSKKSFFEILIENQIHTRKQAMDCVELWDTDNGQTLCVSCHSQTDTYKSKAINKYLKKINESYV